MSGRFASASRQTALQPILVQRHPPSSQSSNAARAVILCASRLRLAASRSRLPKQREFIYRKKKKKISEVPRVGSFV